MRADDETGRRLTLRSALPFFAGMGVAALGTILLLLLPTQPRRALDAPVDPQVPLAPYSRSAHFPPIKAFRLANGLHLLVLEDHRLPRVTATLTLDAGSPFGTTPGVAEMTAAMLSDGTQTRDESSFNDAVERLGATFSSQTSAERAVVTISSLSEQTPTLLGLMADAVLHPAFREERLERRIRDWRADDVRHVGAVVDDIAAAAFYGATPFGRPRAAESDVAALLRDDLVEFHQRYYRPENAILAVAGDVDAAAVRRTVDTLFGAWPPSRDPVSFPPAVFPSPSPSGPRRLHLIDWPYDKESYVTFRCLAVPEGDPDYFPLVVANRILSGDTGRLAEDLREERGYTYGVYSTLYAPPHWPGIWSVDATVPVDKTDDTLREIESQMERMRDEPVGETELNRAKEGAIGSFLLALQYPSTVMGWAVYAERGGLPPDYFAAYPEKIDAVTAADIRRVAAKYFAPGLVQVFVIGPRKKLEPVLQAHGVVRDYDDRGIPQAP